MNETKQNTQTQPKTYATSEAMFEAEHEGASVASLLSEDLSNVDTGMPLLKPCLEDFVCVKAEISTNEENGKQQLRLTLNATKELPDKDGNMLPKEFPHFASIPLTPTERMPASSVRKNVATVTQCFGVKSAGDNGQNLVGKVGQIKVTIQPERSDRITGAVYAERNQFRFVPVEK